MIDLKKKKRSNEYGITLVELLAVLVLISLVTGIIWTTLSITIKYNNSETTKLQMQQEANLIITKLQSIHRSESCYRLTINDNVFQVDGCTDADNIHEILGDNFSYEAKVQGVNTSSGKTPIKPNKMDLKFLKFVVKDKVTDGNQKNVRSIDVPTTIYRIKNTTIKENSNE